MKTRTVSFFFIVCMMNAWAIAETQPDASRILHRFIQSQKNLNSFIIEASEKSTYTYPGFNGTGVSYRKHKWCFDGQQCKNSMYMWGDISVKQRDVNEEDADYHSDLWDGRTGYIYDHGQNPFTGKFGDSVIVVSDSHAKVCSESYKRTTAGLMMGYLFCDYEPMYELFFKPSVKLSLRPKKYPVHGTDCYVLDADVPVSGTYTVWIDPAHDFHIARTQVQRKVGDFIGDMKLVEKNQTIKDRYEVLEFQKIQDFWFPKTCRTKTVNHSENYDSCTESELSIVSVILNPDHEKLQSFEPNDIPDGTPTQLRSRPPSEKYIWQGGKAVPVEKLQPEK